jgi:hypothetical protein
MAAGSAPSVPAFTECAPDADGSHRPDLGSVGTTSRATFKVPRSDAENATSAAGSECIEDQEPGGSPVPSALDLVQRWTRDKSSVVRGDV